MFEFEDPKTPRHKRVPLRIQALAGEDGRENTNFSEAIDHYRVNVYFTSLDLVINELKARFSENDQDVLCALSDIVMKSEPKSESFDLVANHYQVDRELLVVEHDLFTSFKRKYPDTKLDSPGDVLKCMHDNDQLNFLPHFGKVTLILNIIPATSCSAERSFSALRRLETYLRSTMGQDRLSHLALLCIERAYGNTLDIEKVIDVFASRKQRSQYFC